MSLFRTSELSSVRMLKLKTLAGTSLGKVAARGMSGAPQKLECFIDGQKVGRVLGGRMSCNLY